MQSSSTSTSKPISIYLNRMQMMAAAAMPRNLIGQIGRRGGKTSRMIPIRIAQAAWSMKRSAGCIASENYRKILDHLLPEIISGFNALGFVEGQDYVVGKTPPPHFKRPYVCPRSFEHAITFSWGSLLHLISFDYSSSSNGLALDYINIDEAKRLNPDRVDSELMKTLSGHRTTRIDKNTTWGDLPMHLSTTIMSDGFIGKRDYNWISRYAEEATHYNQVYQILMIVDELQRNYSASLERYLWELQRNTTLYINAGTEENLAVLGIEYFKSAFKNSTPAEFRSSILGEKVISVEGGFYTLLDESIHGYRDKNNYGRIETLGIDAYRSGQGNECKLDSDVMPGIPLKLSIDYGAINNWAVAMQNYFNTYYVLKDFWATTPKKYQDIVNDFCDYYEPHNHKVVELYDDPYGHKEKTNTVVKDIEEVIGILKRRGWRVVHMTPKNHYLFHDTKYRICSNILDESPQRDGRYPKFKINLNNAYRTFYSMSKAMLKKGKDEFAKDKSSEADKSIEQWQATHLSDCVDMPLCFDNKKFYDNKTGSALKGI